MVNHNVNIVLKARDEASRKIGGLGKAVVGLGAAFLSYRAIKSVIGGSVAAFMEQEKAANSLANALRLVNAESQAPAMAKFAAEIQRLTIYGDEAVQQVMALGSSMGKLAGEDLKNATVAAIGLSKAYGMDLQAAMRLVARAAVGDTGSLKRYGIVLDASLSTTEKFNEVLRIGRDNFALATGETNTFTGRLAQLKNAFGDAKEKIGQMIAEIPGLVKGMSILKVVFENFKLSMDIVWTATALELVKFWERLKFTLAGAGQLLVWLADNWKNIFTTIWSFTKSVTIGMWENLKNFFTGVVSWLKGEGFNFQWTGLLEGFKSTLTELPNILDRNIGPVEKALAEELAGLKDQFKKQLGLEMNPAALSTGTGSGAAATLAAATGGKIAASESRFLGGATGRDYQKETATQSKRQTDLLAKIEAKIGGLNQVRETIRQSAFT